MDLLIVLFIGWTTVFELYFFGSDCLSCSIGCFVGVEGAIFGEITSLREVIFEIIYFSFGV